MSAADELETLRKAWPGEYMDGARFAFLRRVNGRREPGGYPAAFHAWSLQRRNAWFAGFNRGSCDRFRASQKEAR
jgi:hypothetical protein